MAQTAATSTYEGNREGQRTMGLPFWGKTIAHSSTFFPSQSEWHKAIQAYSRRGHETVKLVPTVQGIAADFQVWGMSVTNGKTKFVEPGDGGTGNFDHTPLLHCRRHKITKSTIDHRQCNAPSFSQVFNVFRETRAGKKYQLVDNIGARLGSEANFGSPKIKIWS